MWLLCAVSLERRTIWFAVAFVLIACLPALHQLLIGADLQRSRLLYLPSVGFCVMVGFAVEGLRPKRTMVLAALVLLGFEWACLQHNERIWRQVALAADNTCSKILQQITPSTRRIVIRDMPGSLDGVYFLRNGLSPCLDLKAGRRLDVNVDETDALPSINPATLAFTWDAVQRSLRKTPAAF